MLLDGDISQCMSGMGWEVTKHGYQDQAFSRVSPRNDPSCLGRCSTTRIGVAGGKEYGAKRAYSKVDLWDGVGCD